MTSLWRFALPLLFCAGLLLQTLHAVAATSPPYVGEPTPAQREGELLLASAAAAVPLFFGSKIMQVPHLLQAAFISAATAVVYLQGRAALQQESFLWEGAALFPIEIENPFKPTEVYSQELDLLQQIKEKGPHHEPKLMAQLDEQQKESERSLMEAFARQKSLAHKATPAQSAHIQAQKRHLRLVLDSYVRLKQGITSRQANYEAEGSLADWTHALDGAIRRAGKALELAEYGRVFFDFSYAIKQRGFNAPPPTFDNKDALRKARGFGDEDSQAPNPH